LPINIYATKKSRKRFLYLLGSKINRLEFSIAIFSPKLDIYQHKTKTKKYIKKSLSHFLLLMSLACCVPSLKTLV